MTFTFTQEEPVYAYHGPLLYEAKVLKSSERTAPDGVTQVKLYLLHYEGWDTHWDEWVPESRLLKRNAHGEKIQKERVKEFNRAHKKRQRPSTDAASGGAAQATGSGGGSGGGGKKRSGDKATDELAPAEIKEQLRLPQAMKLKLIDDWERVTREKKLVPLPREPNITSLLDDFVQAKAKRSTHERLYVEVCDGMRSYFNQSLGSILLYKYETKQFRDATRTDAKKATALVDIYGAEHLLRLFVKLPELLSHCKLQREHMTVLLAKLAELLKFMQANKAKYFVSAYDTPSEEYLHWWGNE